VESLKERSATKRRKGKTRFFEERHRENRGSHRVIKGVACGGGPKPKMGSMRGEVILQEVFTRNIKWFGTLRVSRTGRHGQGRFVGGGVQRPVLEETFNQLGGNV